MCELYCSEEEVIKMDKQIQKQIDELIKKFKATTNWSNIVPAFDEDALMVHWTNNVGDTP